MDEKQRLLTGALDVGEGLLTHGAEVGRVEDTLTRILTSQGAVRVDVFTITTSIIVTCRFPDCTLTQTRRVRDTSYDMTALTALNGLSRDVCAGGVSPDEVPGRVRAIEEGPAYPFIATVLFYGLAGFAFSMFFGGGLLDAVLSGCIGLLIRLMLWGLRRLQVPGIAVTLLCAMAGGFLANGCRLIGLPCSPDKIAIGDIMLLVPGISIMTAVRDMFTGDTISGLLRFFEAALLSLALALGFALPSLL